ncbi:molybdopterin converting factor subunit 1 [Ketogulonicigenium vulgare]|uniref:Molybdopterin synthase subunit MoaD n=1 Tax=Ketogulonicigenium vulgare (strain WSH-001) TaxID=759362 RepID=F9Y8E7_KETVW|nr:molybdopterin converting factor subunit 1 [Ketogulonicigenium vulgare]ADO41721.1 putative molybdopterin MPT converting factor, subunit 1 protein [Ketogulonicigenium vulgare Y25]AEM39956.1 Molybdopterin synthase subunit MoaD [Ketogulonicigenium vulgare WSH-001]ALJ80166.1 molybdenum cofactor biosynthesis protein MoaD [Ketogulonicigenium vulgare]ANW34886.1 molybdopterin converting factor subunit 1 [Ketogulonicigenium vulgare]AOZ53652.1 molybdopterin MPT converting factor, subunit 1 protein [Ke
MNILYFAWLRERIGQRQEQMTPIATTVGALIDELSARSAGHASAFADRAAIRAAVDQELVDLDASIIGAREIAFFPPMTGG